MVYGAVFGPEKFFGRHYGLFYAALEQNRPDFVTEFLPLTRVGLIESNVTAPGNKGLLALAIESASATAVTTIVQCWSKFLSTEPTHEHDLLFDEDKGRVSTSDMVLLATHFPRDFEALIRSIKLIRYNKTTLPEGTRFLHRQQHGGFKMATFHADLFAEKHILTRSHSASIADSSSNRLSMKSASSRSSDTSSRTAAKLQASAADNIAGMSALTALDRRSIYRSSAEHQHHSNSQEGLPQGGDAQAFYFLPIKNAVHMQMLAAFTHCCHSLNSVEIFNSNVGKFSLSYAWREFGRKAHLSAMIVYLAYVALITVSTMTFKWLTGFEAGTVAIVVLIVLQLLMDVYFLFKEGQQFAPDPYQYVLDCWNLIDILIYVGNITATIIRAVNWSDTPSSRVILSIVSIAAWFNILYHLRAFEVTGPLVSMIIQISKDIRFLILVVVIVLVGFSQAFWLISDGIGNAPFYTFRGSLVYSFTFMLGGYDPTSFQETSLEDFGVFLSAVYMVIVAILLLNLLIALMADGYSEVRSKGLAQWKLEQAQIIVDMQGSMPPQTAAVRPQSLFCAAWIPRTRQPRPSKKARRCREWNSRLRRCKRQCAR